jgi:cytidylate kinase
LSNPASRLVRKLVEEQVRHWQHPSRAIAPRRPREPVITISRLSGCGGGALARELAARLKFDFFGEELLHEVAQSSHLSETMLRTVDEKALSVISEWIESLFIGSFLTGDYINHLSKVLMVIREHGRAVILGRGACFILPPGSCLRVLLTAPLEDRIQAVAARQGLTERDAKRWVARTESQRHAFIRQHFHADSLDSSNYDLVLNTSGLGREAVLAAIQAAWESKSRKFPWRPPSDAVSQERH